MNRLTRPTRKSKLHVAKTSDANAPKRLVLYARKSTMLQADSSPETQIQRMKDYCNLMGHAVVDVKTETASGGSLDRPELQAALELVFSDNADGIIVAYMDRFARSTKDFLAQVEKFRAAGKVMVFLDLNLDTSNAMGEFAATVLMAAFQMMRKQSAEKTRDAFHRYRENGQYDKGRPPYGWKTTVDEDGKSLHTLEPNEAEQQVLAQIIESYESGLSFSTIAKDLNDAGIPTRDNGTWRHVQVSRIIKALESQESP